MGTLLLLAISLFPGVALLIYILYMDRNEREPIGLVLKTLCLGAVSTLLAIAVEMSMDYVHPIFSDEAPKTILTAFVQSFIQIAPIEEFSKLIVVLLFIWKNPEFNEENDGIVYVSASALGFAIFENIFYVVSGGFGVGIARAITAMPLHCFTGVIMGYYVGLAKFAETSSEARNKIIIGFLLAVFIHGAYDTFALSGAELALLIIPTIIMLLVVGIKILKKGRQLSIVRWSNTSSTGYNINTESLSDESIFGSSNVGLESEQQIDETHHMDNIHKSPASKGTWKVWVSRPIILLSLLFWAALIAGSMDEKNTDDFLELMMGGVIITIFPIVISILLEVSYFQGKRG